MTQIDKDISPPRRDCGFTLVEAATAVAIVGILLAASAGALVGVARLQRTQLERRNAYTLAEQLMGEIVQQYFSDQNSPPVFGPEANETRPVFDDVDDYNGYSATPPVQQNGAAMPGFAGWTESVAVTYVDPNNPANTLASSTLKRITVTITSPAGKQYSLVGLRSQYGPYEAQPLNQTNYVTGVSVSVQTSTAGTPVYTNAHPLNESTSQ
jgi:MSHA pilin protein MshD